MLAWKDDRALDAIMPAKPAQAIGKALGVHTVGELLQHYPRAWSHHGAGVNLDSANDGDTVTCVATVMRSTTQRTNRGKTIFKTTLTDGSQTFTATFFNAWLPQRQLKQGTKAMFSGKVKNFRGSLEISHPTYVIIPEPGRKERATGGLKNLQAFGSAEELEDILTKMDFLPVYPAKKGTTSWELIGAMNAALATTPHIPEPLDFVPDNLPSFDAAIRGIHQPDAQGPAPFVKRIKYNEALSLALVMALRRVDNATRRAPALPVKKRGGVRKKLLQSLPYELTAGQVSVTETIAEDIAKTVPMSRLLQGEVGSGKTIVALVAMCQAIDNGKQTAFLAPTEVLATQHAQSIAHFVRMADLGLTVTLLTGSMSVGEKRQALLDIVSGDSDIVIGTHAIIQQAVEFFDLGLVVVDEQHRFGVEQRDTLRSKGKDGLTPHLLVMTATPIPRTIAMTFFGDLAVSYLAELPGGRQPIESFVVPGWNASWVARTWERIREDVAAGGQAFVVCPKIDGDGGVEETFALLQQKIFPDLKVGILHGRLSRENKDTVMAAFSRGEIQILVATTVIEVGIDVPNATIMYIRHADRFGVSQLHQLRGRVGRGNRASLCLIHTDLPEDSEAYQRLIAVAGTTDGFQLAEIDLRSRQEGDVLGTAQSGAQKKVKLLSLVDDTQIIRRAAADAQALVERNPDLARHLVSDVDLSDQEFIEKS